LDISSALESIRKNIVTLAKDYLRCHRLEHNKPWFDNEWSKLIDQWKQVNLQWLQNPSQINGDNLHNLTHETGGIFRNKEREYLKNKVNEPETNHKNKNITDLYRGINEFKKAKCTWGS
jgi:hypothetical protein